MKLIQFYRAVITRETIKLLKQKDRLASAMVRPVLWLWIIGGGMQALAGDDYLNRLIPGIIGMTLLFGGMVGGLSVAFDKDAGTMRLLVTAPFATQHVLMAKTLAATVAALVQTALLLALLMFIEGLGAGLQLFEIDLIALFPWVGQSQWPNLWIVPALLLGAVVCAALGVLCGVYAKSIDGFAVMMNFVIFPVFFFSGALYPTQPMPWLAKWIAQVNPFSHCVDLLRHSFSSHAEFNLLYSGAYLLICLVLMLWLAVLKFRRGGAAISLQQG